MADVRISALDALTVLESGDVFLVEEVSGPAGKKVTLDTLRTWLGAVPLAVAAVGTPGATAAVNQNVPAGSLTLPNVSSPAGEPGSALIPYYLRITDGVNTEDVVVVDRSGATRTLVAPTLHAYDAGSSTVAYAGLATSPSFQGVLLARDFHALRAAIAPSLLSLPERPADPAVEDDAVRIFVRDLSGTSTLYARTDDGTVHELTSRAKRTTVRTLAGTSEEVDVGNDGQLVRCTSGSAVTITVPSGLPAGLTVEYVQEGAGQIEIVGSGVTIRVNASFVAKTAGQWSPILVTVLDTNEALVRGDLEPVP